jgi:hypothetical protein
VEYGSAAEEREMSNFERFFQDPDPKKGPYLKFGMSGIACRNLRTALGYLKFRLPPGDDYDEKLRDAVLAFQQQIGHKRQDGILGPETRKLLIEKLIAREREGESIFQRLDEPGPPLKKPRPSWLPGDFQTLATLVDRDAPELEPVLTVARRALGCGMGDLLDTGKGSAVYSVASALYEALRCGTEILYDYEPANPGEGRQEVRVAREVLADRVGTCLDLALMFAALLERGHLAPAVVLADPGGTWHAMAGYFRELDPSHHGVVITDGKEIRRLTEEGILTPVEVTGLSAVQGVKKDFYQARRKGLEKSRRYKPLAVVNILAARNQGLVPGKP